MIMKSLGREKDVVILKIFIISVSGSVAAGSAHFEVLLEKL